MRAWDRRSNVSRADLIAAQFACSHVTSPRTGCMNRLPSGVELVLDARRHLSVDLAREQAITLEATQRGRQHPLRDAGMLRFSSENLARWVGPSSSMAITSRLHLSPTRSSISRNSQS